MKEKLLLLGHGGHAKSLIDSIEAAGIYEIAGLIDNGMRTNTGYRGYKVVGCDEELKELFRSGIHCACIGVGFLGEGNARNRLYTCLKEIGYTLPVIIDPSAVLAKDVKIGEGTFIGKGAMINADTQIGKMVIVNTAAVIEHDCFIGDFCHVAVAGTICGTVRMGKNVFIGANATVIQGIRIGDNALIGAGTVVVKNVGENIKLMNKIVPVSQYLPGGVICGD